jgi:hypothetical protein
MAIDRTSFTQIPSSGLIPDDMVPAEAFALSFTFSYTGYPSLSTFNHTFTGTVKVHVLNPDDSIKYSVEIQETYNLFIFPLAPGLVLFTWNWQPSAEFIVGRIGADSDEAPQMSTLGAGSFGVEPAEGSGTSNGEVIIDSTFYSGIFTESLDLGDKVKIKFHNLSAGYVVSRASLRLATELGSSVLDAVRDGRTGETWAFYADNGKLQCARSRRREGFALRDTDSVVLDGAASHVRAIRSGPAVLCVAATSKSLYLTASLDSGASWKDIMFSGATVKPLASTGDGNVVYIYGLATAADAERDIAKDDRIRVVLRRSAGINNWVLERKEKVSGEPPTKNIFNLLHDGGMFRLLARVKDDAGSEIVGIWVSTDELASWKEVTPIETPQDTVGAAL